MGPVVILGAGAMGTWLAVRMSQVEGIEVALLARPERAAALTAAGPRLEVLPEADPSGTGGILEAGRGFTLTSDPGSLPRTPQLAVLTVRAYQTTEAARLLNDADIQPAGILTLQNGLGNAEALAEVFGADRVVAGTTTHGVTFEPPARVVHAGAGDTVLGPWTPEATGRAGAAARALIAAGIEVSLVDDPRAALWRKVAVNTAINPPTAIHRIENGRLLDGGAREQELEAAAREAARVAVREGVPLDEEETAMAARRVAKRTARNQSSMLQALLAGRPLETEAITGEIVERAARHGIPVPVNAAHLARLRALRPATTGQR